MERKLLYAKEQIPNMKKNYQNPRCSTLRVDFESLLNDTSRVSETGSSIINTEYEHHSDATNSISGYDGGESLSKEGSIWDAFDD